MNYPLGVSPSKGKQGTTQIDTATETTVAKETILHKVWPRIPRINQEPALNPVSSHGKAKNENSRSDMAMFTMKKLIVFLMVFVL